MDALVDRVRLHRQGDSSTVVLCEGSPDHTVLRNLLSRRRAIFPAGPRTVVLAALDSVLSKGLGPAVAVVDRDFDGVQAALDAGLPVVAYDGADLESMLWESDVLDESLRVLGNETKINALGGAAALRGLVDDLVRPLQRLRVANLRSGLGLDFDSVDLRRRIKPGELLLNVGGLCDALRGERTDVTRSWLVERATSEDLPTCPVTGRPLFRGKDRLGALGVVLKRRAGQLSHAEAHFENVGRTFYSFAHREYLAGSPWLTELDQHLS